MLTSLDFLSAGKPWPPVEERKRLHRYAYNRKLFNNDCDEKYKEQAKRVGRVIGNYVDLVSYHVALNYPKRISVKTADLLLGEHPLFDSGDSTDAINDIILRNGLIGGTLREVVLDISMCGDGLLYVRQDNGKAIVDIAAPEIWFPVVSPDNIKKITCHVLGWTYVVTDGKQKVVHLKICIHEKGKYTQREYILHDGAIGQQIGADIVVDTGLDDFAIQHIPNTTTSRDLYGHDDYEDIDSIVNELEIRIDQIAKVLDKHTDPTMQGPASALADDGNGNKIFPAGNFVVNQDEAGNTADVGYLTWDAQLTANFTLIDKLIDQLYTQSEMGAAIFGDTANKGGSIPSGTALRRMMISPLAKVSRIREKLDPALKNALKMAAQLDGVRVDEISIAWKDGLPDDPKESAEIMNIRTGNKATISQYSAIQQLDGRSDDDIESELELIRQDDEITNGGFGQSVDTTPLDEGGEDGDE